jgi:hypothetical protein
MNKSRAGLIMLVAVFVTAMLAIIIYSSFGIHPYEVEICITYKGRTNCGTAAGATREQALSAGARIACASIASGMTERIACDDTRPDSVRWLRESQ